jgi:hypothetical protein
MSYQSVFKIDFGQVIVAAKYNSWSQPGGTKKRGQNCPAACDR